jgi:hypothetical protein
MDDSVLDGLPRAYRIGLRLGLLGADDDLIADCLEIDPRSVVTLLEIGARKLAHAQGARTTDGSLGPANTDAGPERDRFVPGDGPQVSKTTIC